MVSVDEAERLARELLAGMPARLRHVEAVARRAVEIAGAVEPDERDVLIAAAWLHDIGYADEAVRTGSHHLDGANYLSGLDEERLAGLVAFHGAALEEARLRGLDNELLAFSDEDSRVSQALTYCDLVTRADGTEVTLEERIGDVRERYGGEHVVARALEDARARLERVVANVEGRLASVATR